MLKGIRVSLVAVLAIGMAGAVFADADPTRHEIYEAAQAGHLAEAQKMIDQVLKDHPQNAQAHFIAAEIDARIGDLGAARQQLATAKQLDPTSAFTSARSLDELTRQLSGTHSTVVVPGAQSFAPSAPAAARSAVPWGTIILVALGAIVFWSIFRPRPQSSYVQGAGPNMLPPGNPGMQPGYGSGYPPYPQQGGGSGFMGNLASGLAIGAGVAAGEELVRHVVDGHGSEENQRSTEFRDPPQNQDMGGNDFGTSDNGSWGNDSGGGDWGGDSGGGGGDWS